MNVILDVVGSIQSADIYMAYAYFSTFNLFVRALSV
jgi:hypothetical protein